MNSEEQRKTGTNATTPRLGVLDPAYCAVGSSRTDAVRDSVQLARHAETLGYHRYWLSEHHGFLEYASTAPELLTVHILSRTDRIRVGPAGMLLPNHRNARVAELFDLLCAISPKRIDFGIGTSDGSCERQTAESISVERAENDHVSQRLREVLSMVLQRPTAQESIWTLTAGGDSLSTALTFNSNLAFAHFVNGSDWSPQLLREAPQRALAAAVALGEREHEALSTAQAWENWRRRSDRCSASIFAGAVPTGSLPTSVIYGDARTLPLKLRQLSAGITDLIVMPIAPTHARRVRALTCVASAFERMSIL